MKTFEGIKLLIPNATAAPRTINAENHPQGELHDIRETRVQVNSMQILTRFGESQNLSSGELHHVRDRNRKTFAALNSKKRLTHNRKPKTSEHVNSLPGLNEKIKNLNARELPSCCEVKNLIEVELRQVIDRNKKKPVGP